MTDVLDCLIAITSQGQRKAVDAALANGLRAVADALHCEVHAISGPRDDRSLQTQACSSIAADAADADHIVSAQPPSVAPVRRGLNEVPALAACIDRREPYACEINPDLSVTTWLPIQEERGAPVQASVSLRTRSAPDAALLATVHGMLAVYRNFTRLLEDNELDSLTGLLNRKTFDRQFSDLVGTMVLHADAEAGLPERRTDDNETASWLAVIDIDHFKRINDQYGHVYGDEVLILLANILKASFRDQDRVFRFGGEEFVVLLRATGLDHARRSFERLRATVGSYAFPQIKNVTISLGFVSISEDTPVTILGRADQALYFAKEHGRDQVCFYDELASSGKLTQLISHQEADFF